MNLCCSAFIKATATDTKSANMNNNASTACLIFTIKFVILILLGCAVCQFTNYYSQFDFLSLCTSQPESILLKLTHMGLTTAKIELELVQDMEINDKYLEF